MRPMNTTTITRPPTSGGTKPLSDSLRLDIAACFLRLIQRSLNSTAVEFWVSSPRLRTTMAGDRMTDDPQDVVRAHLAAIERWDPRIHAYVYVDRNARGAAGSMSGVTLAVKDNLPVAGMPWTDGSAVWRDRIAGAGTVPLARARAAGAALLRQTNPPEPAPPPGSPH